MTTHRSPIGIPGTHTNFFPSQPKRLSLKDKSDGNCQRFAFSDAPGEIRTFEIAEDTDHSPRHLKIPALRVG